MNKTTHQGDVPLGCIGKKPVYRPPVEDLNIKPSDAKIEFLCVDGVQTVHLL